MMVVKWTGYGYRQKNYSQDYDKISLKSIYYQMIMGCVLVEGKCRIYFLYSTKDGIWFFFVEKEEMKLLIFLVVL